LNDRNRSSKTIQTYCQYLETFEQKQGVINTDSIRDFLKENITFYQPNSLKIFRQALSSYSKFAKIVIE
jgi:5'-deoxynucleotidase YfbR-like HD superfamily hydrolase